jgi:sugar/nucleoside kinase (ribokinase family)
MNSSFDIIFIGHFARDTIISSAGEISSSLGGGVTFGTLAARYYDVNQKIGIFSKIGKDFDLHWLDIFNHGIDLTGLCANSTNSTHFNIQYFPEGGRKLTLKSKASPMAFEDIPPLYLNSKSFMISSIANEISFEFIKDLVDNTQGWIGIDIQGFIRDFRKDGSINPEPLPALIQNMQKIIKYCGNRLILKASEDEINYIANCNNVVESTQKIAQLEDFIVCTTLGPLGSLIKCRNEKMIHIPAFYPDNGVVDETGAGDAYLSIFLSEFIDSNHSLADIKKCGFTGSCAASFLIEQKGPLGFGTKKEIQWRISQRKIIPSHFENMVKDNKL